MTDRVQALGNTHPRISEVYESLLLRDLPLEERLGEKGAGKYEAALVRLAADSVETTQTESAISQEITEIKAAAAARDEFAIHLLHKIARIEQLQFDTPDDMVEEFRRAILPWHGTQIEFIPGDVFTEWLEEEKVMPTTSDSTHPQLGLPPKEQLGLIAADFLEGRRNPMFSDVFTPEMYMAVASPILGDLATQMSPGSVFSRRDPLGDGK